MMHIRRFHEIDPSTIRFTPLADQATQPSGEISLNVFAGAMLVVTGTSTGGAITITFRTKLASGATTSYIVANASDSPVTLTVQPNRAYALPDELFAARHVTATTPSGWVDCRVFGKA